MTNFVVEIVQTGCGGSIVYREGENHIDFGWEFANPPAMALVFGPSARLMDKKYPWATGRCEVIYNAVGTEVVRQKVEGGSYTVDLESGIIHVLSTSNCSSE